VQKKRKKVAVWCGFELAGGSPAVNRESANPVMCLGGEMAFIPFFAKRPLDFNNFIS
jgi:hypothetical protein